MGVKGDPREHQRTRRYQAGTGPGRPGRLPAGVLAPGLAPGWPGRAQREIRSGGGPRRVVDRRPRGPSRPRGITPVQRTPDRLYGGVIGCRKAHAVSRSSADRRCHRPWRRACVMTAATPRPGLGSSSAGARVTPIPPLPSRWTQRRAGCRRTGIRTTARSRLPGDRTNERPDQPVTTGTSYLAMFGSRVMRVRPPSCACTTSRRSNGSR